MLPRVVGLSHYRHCFTKYVATKVLKRLESNKIRGGFKNPQKVLLVPVSFGASSLSLLHVLDQQQQNRAQQYRHSGFKLHVLFVDQSTVIDHVDTRAIMDLLEQRYPSHMYTTISLEDCIDYGVHFEGISSDEQTRLHHIISSLETMTSKVDFIEIARRRLILAFAKQIGIDNILFGDSTTRLAEKTLSETAKGRGVTLPRLVADGIAEGVQCIYPMRDLLRSEITVYTNIVTPPLASLILDVSYQIPASSKDSTIDGLMSQYFESVERNYPSIVANVVRTSEKLAAQPVSEACDSCSVCRNRIATKAWGGEQQGSVTSSQSADKSSLDADPALCYGCARTLLKP